MCSTIKNCQVLLYGGYGRENLKESWNIVVFDIEVDIATSINFHSHTLQPISYSEYQIQMCPKATLFEIEVSQSFQ